jgi:hypothetical protein
MVAISLSGYVFFGSATIISEKALLISDLLLKTADWAENIPAQALDPLEVRQNESMSVLFGGVLANILGCQRGRGWVWSCVIYFCVCI